MSSRAEALRGFLVLSNESAAHVSRRATHKQDWEFMPKSLKVYAEELVANVREKFEEIDAIGAIEINGDQAQLSVDLRDVRERQMLGQVLGSFHCPRGVAEFWTDPECPNYKDVFGLDRKFVSYCGSG
jgi:hypothetical protein